MPGPKATAFLLKCQNREILALRRSLPRGSDTAPCPYAVDKDLHDMLVFGELQPGKLKKLGTLTYQCGDHTTLNQGFLSGLAPHLFANPPGVPGLPKLLIIHSFYSNYEDSVKGIGSALLRAILEACELNDTQYVVVVGGINPEVYEAFGFQEIGPVQTWWTTVAALRHRLARPMPPLQRGVRRPLRRASAEAPF